MASSRIDSGRVRLLKFARKEIARLARPAAQKRSTTALRRLDDQASHLRRLLAAGKLPKAKAARFLVRLTKARREVARLISATEATSKRTLAAIDYEIRHATRKG